jgi:hypothetical protein
MAYYYADSSPFPLNCNFLDTVRRVTGACVRLLDLGESLQIRNASAATAAELVRAFEGALVLHEFPETRSSLCWRAGRRRETSLIARDSTYFRCELQRAVPLAAGDAFAAPVRIDAIAPGLSLTLPRRRWWFGSAGRGAVGLDRHYLHGVEAGDGLAVLNLSRSPRRRDEETTVVLRGLGQSTPILVHASGDADGAREATPLAAEEVAGMHTLWRRAVAALWKRCARSAGHLLGGVLDGRPLTEVRPELLAERLIAAMAPLLAEIRYRSGRRDLLMLLRDRDQGGHDQLALSVGELENAIGVLSADKQCCFAPMGIGPHDERYRAITAAFTAFDTARANP